MAIGTTAAILGSAALGAGASALSSKSASDAQKRSAQASQQAADQATAEQRRQFDLARADSAPWLQTGTSALSSLATLTGLNGPATGYNWNQYLIDNPDVADAIAKGGFGGTSGPGGAAGAAQRHFEEYGTIDGRVAPPRATNMDAFIASPDYQFRQNEQARALTARNAALGIQDSGAAQRSALQYSGNLAAGEFNTFANRLAALSGVGQTAAAQNASLGQNFAGAIGNIAQNNAQNLSSSYQNQAAIRGNAYGDIAGIGAGLLGGFSRPATAPAAAAATGPGSTYFAGLYR